MSCPLVCYGSSKGKAMNYARIIAERYNTEAVTMNSVSLQDLAQSAVVAIFIVSTWGKGTFPDNAINFYNELQKSDLLLPSLRFAVLGLGSSKCRLYDQAARDLFRVLESRGARPLIPLSEVDARAADKGESVFIQWSRNLETHLPFSNIDDELHPRLTLEPEETCPEWEPPRGYMNATIVKSEVLSADGVKPVIFEHILRIDGLTGYDTACHIKVLPQNPPESVDKVITALHLNGDDAFRVTGEYPGPPVVTVRELFSQYIDLEGLPTQFMIHAFSRYSSGAGREKMLRLLSDNEFLTQYLSNTSVHEFICEFAEYGVPPLSVVASYCPEMMHRTYSAASAQGDDPSLIKIIVTRVGFNGRTGLASSFLARCRERIPVCVVNGVYTPADTPLIMCAIGTGIGPMLSVIEERQARGVKSPCFLFFGSRHRAAIPGLVAEVEAHKASGAITDVFYAFSRDHGENKYYITHAMRENTDRIWEVWENGEATLFYCGPARGIPEEIKEILENVSMKKGCMDLAEATKFCKKHRWLIESF